MLTLYEQFAITLSIRCTLCICCLLLSTSYGEIKILIIVIDDIVVNRLILGRKHRLSYRTVEQHEQKVL